MTSATVLPLQLGNMLDDEISVAASAFACWALFRCALVLPSPKYFCQRVLSTASTVIRFYDRQPSAVFSSIRPVLTAFD